MAKLTVLRVADEGKKAAKTFFLNDDGVIEKSDYDKDITGFFVELIEVNNIQSLSATLKDLSDKSDHLVIRGIPISNISPTTKVTKTKHDIPSKHQKAYFKFHPDGQPWVCIDVDDIATPADMNFLKYPEECVEYLVSLLPDYFHEVSYHYQLSNSAGVYGGDVLKAHIWFWLDNPVHDNLLKYWANQTNKKVGVKLIDVSLFNDVQAHYTSNPVIMAGVADPFPNNRSAFVEKQKHQVEFPPVVLQGYFSGCTAGLKPAGDFEGWLKLVGDHQDGEGFYEPLLHAAWYYVLEHGGDQTDVDALVSKLKEVIVNADKSKHDSHALLAKYNDHCLKGMVTSAIAKIGAKGKTGKISDVDPYYPQPNLCSTDEASKSLKELTQDFFDKPRDMAIKAPAGLGKTTEIIFELCKAWKHDKKVEIYVPNHTLGDEICMKSEYVPHAKPDAFWQKGKPSGVECVVMRGRSYKDSKGTYCLKNPLAAELSRKGFSVYPNLCRNPKHQCEHYSDCRYIQQYSKEYDVRVFPHAYLGLDRGFLGADFPDYAVIDESFYQSLISQSTTVSPDEIKKSDWPLELKECLIHGLVLGKPVLGYLRDSLGDGVIEAIDQAKETLEKKTQASLIHLYEDDQKEAVKALPDKNHLGKLLEILETELATDRADSHGIGGRTPAVHAECRFAQRECDTRRD